MNTLHRDSFKIISAFLSFRDICAVACCSKEWNVLVRQQDFWEEMRKVYQINSDLEWRNKCIRYATIQRNLRDQSFFGFNVSCEPPSSKKNIETVLTNSSSICVIESKRQNPLAMKLKVYDAATHLLQSSNITDLPPSGNIVLMDDVWLKRDPDSMTYTCFPWNSKKGFNKAKMVFDEICYFDAESQTALRFDDTGMMEWIDLKHGRLMRRFRWSEWQNLKVSPLLKDNWFFCHSDHHTMYNLDAVTSDLSEGIAWTKPGDSAKHWAIHGNKMVKVHDLTVVVLSTVDGVVLKSRCVEKLWFSMGVYMDAVKIVVMTTPRDVMVMDSLTLETLAEHRLSRETTCVKQTAMPERIFFISNHIESSCWFLDYSDRWRSHRSHIAYISSDRNDAACTTGSPDHLVIAAKLGGNFECRCVWQDFRGKNRIYKFQPSRQSDLLSLTSTQYPGINIPIDVKKGDADDECIYIKQRIEKDRFYFVDLTMNEWEKKFSKK